MAKLITCKRDSPSKNRIYYRYSLINIMGVMDSLIEKSVRCAELAERLGLDEEVMAYRKDSQTFMKIKDGLEQIGEEI